MVVSGINRAPSPPGIATQLVTSNSTDISTCQEETEEASRRVVGAQTVPSFPSAPMIVEAGLDD